MKTTHFAVAALLALSALPVTSQSLNQNPAGAPKLALLVYQQTQAGRTGARQELETSLARAFDRLQAPLSWIELEAVTGPPGALFFDPGKSYDDIEKAGAQLASIFAAHPELAQKQQSVDELLTSSSTVVALRRDDLGYRTETLDLAKARFLQIETVRVRPGHKRDFADAQTTLRSALEKSHSDIARVVYQVDHGIPAPTFLIVEVLHSLKELDDRITARASLERTVTEVERVHLEQIARDAYESRQSNLYGIHPEMSHVSKDFAMQDPQFWVMKETQ
jgi:hypothetical protein